MPWWAFLARRTPHKRRSYKVNMPHCGPDCLLSAVQVGIKPDLRCHALDAPPLRGQTRASLEELPPGEYSKLP